MPHQRLGPSQGTWVHLVSSAVAAAIQGPAADDSPAALAAAATINIVPECLLTGTLAARPVAHSQAARGVLF